MSKKYHTNFYSHESIVLITHKKIFYKAAAIFGIATILGLPWSLIAIGRILPTFIVNKIYDSVAKRRHQLATSKHCAILPHAKIIE